MSEYASEGSIYAIVRQRSWIKRARNASRVIGCWLRHSWKKKKKKEEKKHAGNYMGRSLEKWFWTVNSDRYRYLRGGCSSRNAISRIGPPSNLSWLITIILAKSSPISSGFSDSRFTLPRCGALFSELCYTISTVTPAAFWPREESLF